eukprot:gnl/MRDRNA2_/MRDRNA2_64661_c0_seq2.p1 gnl/MRDRNA2_/MRDRNA2_64661_c0~~gnl/MRDRNA2_/MRDRNA2_64661_c0_seq2.p1  ORF type:complete len:157 (-),score=12.20 gnl/MRDRNA2_/MRDRNA2_64661_c0_seq2:43-513(-)
MTLTSSSERAPKRARATLQMINVESMPVRHSAPEAGRKALGAQDLPGLSSFASCVKHGNRNLALKRVRKQGANNSRLFFTCRSAGCSFFQWADTHFPRCSCHLQPCAVLRVSKKEGSGGRWFFACRGASANQRCNYFMWASASQLQPLQGLLSPLT